MANAHGEYVPTQTHSALKIAADEARTWLFDELLPVWSQAGRDPSGGFVEQIGLDGRALSLPKRCRVQARQIYVFAEAGRLGWSGPWQDAMENGIAFLFKSYVRDDGLMRFKVNQSGEIVDDSVDNYDQAFTLFALAHAQRATGHHHYRARAEHLLSVLRAVHGHPQGGFHESKPPTAPLRSNPHMHLLEAALAWMDVDPSPAFHTLASEIGVLATEAFIDGPSGALRELFELDWSPAKGETGLMTEPGHQFEWAWLLMRLTAHETGPGVAVADRLYQHGDRFGIDRRRHVAINEVRLDGSPIDTTARLWPQTERMKAALAMAAVCEPGSTAQMAYEEAAVDSWRGLKQYRIAGRPGLFYDKFREDGSFVEEPAFASSLYHITCAISELIRATERLA